MERVLRRNYTYMNKYYTIYIITKEILNRKASDFDFVEWIPHALSTRNTVYHSGVNWKVLFFTNQKVSDNLIKTHLFENKKCLVISIDDLGTVVWKPA